MEWDKTRLSIGCLWMRHLKGNFVSNLPQWLQMRNKNAKKCENKNRIFNLNCFCNWSCSNQRHRIRINGAKLSNFQIIWYYLAPSTSDSFNYFCLHFVIVLSKSPRSRVLPPKGVLGSLPIKYDLPVSPSECVPVKKGSKRSYEVVKETFHKNCSFRWSRVATSAETETENCKAKKKVFVGIANWILTRSWNLLKREFLNLPSFAHSFTVADVKKMESNQHSFIHFADVFWSFSSKKKMWIWIPFRRNTNTGPS